MTRPGAIDDEVILHPGGSSTGYWKELWCYRELFFFLALRDLKVRYKQTMVGVAWAAIRPLIQTIIFVAIFSGMAQLHSPNDIPYSLIVIAAMIPWQFFAAVMGEGSNSLLANSNLISKVYFPRIIIPTSVVAVALADLMITCILALVLMLGYRFAPPVQMILLPFFLAMALAAALGVCLWLSSLTIRYRDVRFVIPFLLQFGLYATPVGFSTYEVASQYRPFFALNPMVGVIEGFRWCLLGTGAIEGWILPISTTTAVLFLLSGFIYFRATERLFADTI